jgi:RNA polymerase sigma factor (TIGR02999 family)
MATSPDETLARLMACAEDGDRSAKEALFTALYAELHRLAEAQIRRSPGQVTLSATTLLHEAYLDLVKRDSAAFPDRNRFLGYASRAMRGLIINYVRNRRVQKRGGDLTFVQLDESCDAAVRPDENLESLSEVLNELAALQPDLAELVDLKFFCGFSFAEIAAMRGVSERTIQREWAKARLLLHRSLSDD